MRVLVTGAGGFLGRAVVAALGRRGHALRALDLPGRLAGVAGGGVEPVEADLAGEGAPPAALAGADAVLHLAARLGGGADEIVRDTVGGTRRLLEGMERAGVARLVLASSLSVYDWAAARGSLDERAPLEPHPEARDAYTVAKLEQERLVRDWCARTGGAAAILRPGFLWGRGREWPATIGQRAGPLLVLVEPGRQLPLVHVENCADAFAAVLDAGAAGTFDVVDAPELTVARFVRDHLRRGRRSGLLVPVPYRVGRAAVGVVSAAAPAPLRRRLPSFLGPARFEARYKPVRIDGARLRAAIGWRPPLGYEECLDRTYGAGP